MENHMTEDEVRTLANRLLKEDLGKFGFREVKVAVAEDRDGEEFFDISAYFDPARTLPNPRATIRSSSRLRQELLKKGENRFPNVLHFLPDR